MATQQELDQCYMAVAEAHSQLSKGIRAKVGCCIVTTNGVMLGGCNGLAPKGGNCLEDKVYASIDAGGWLDDLEVKYPYEDENGRYKLITKSEVIHAELNSVLKAAKEGVSLLGATLYVTLSPCLVCAEMLVAVGIQRVVYSTDYRCTHGLTRLQEADIVVEKLNKAE